jgi:hypothetical protein
VRTARRTRTRSGVRWRGRLLGLGSPSQGSVTLWPCLVYDVFWLLSLCLSCRGLFCLTTHTLNGDAGRPPRTKAMRWDRPYGQSKGPAD